MKCFIKQLFPLSLVSVAAIAAGAAQITIDEFGHGTNGITVLPFTLAADPTGGVPNWNVLIYTLPFAGVKGDVAMHDPLLPGSPIHDVIRFDGTNHMIFYSDNIDGYTSPADTPGPPNPFYANLFHIDEETLGFLVFADYKPDPGDPGYDASNPEFRFISEIPEPSAAILLLGGLGFFGLAQIRRKLGSRTQAKESASGSGEV